MANKNFTSVSFQNLRWTIDENTRLSISHWGDAHAITYAVALFRKVNGKWSLDHSTAQEFRGRNEKDMAFRSTDYGATLAKSILGANMPERFFRDNCISK